MSADQRVFCLIGNLVVKVETLAAALEEANAKIAALEAAASKKDE